MESLGESARRDSDTLDVASLNVKNVKTNLNFVKHLSSRYPIIFLQETWLYRYQTNILTDIFDNTEFSGPHFRLPRFDSPLTTPSEVKINGRRILPVINYNVKTLYSLNVYTQVYTLLSKILFICRNKIVLWFFTYFCAILKAN